ncbi:MAG: hypothetical protein LUQ33_02495 [Methanoregulaceae archaeon]|nr:hypothetical protein [Methanoregulaceae archaeon]
MKKNALLILLFLLFCGVLGSYWLLAVHPFIQSSPAESSGEVMFEETFNTGFLDPERWKLTRDCDVRQSIIDVVAADPMNPGDSRLRLGMDTIGTRDDTVKYIGIRSNNRFKIGEAKEISFDLDWNNQSNGCYLTAAFYICPTKTSKNPEQEPEWFKIEYIGVPPGKNGRAVIATKGDDRVRYWYTEGWPEKRDGRSLGNKHITIVPHINGITILENGTFLNTLSLEDMEFESAYLYFQMSSHSNYPFREVYFDNISVK